MTRLNYTPPLYISVIQATSHKLVQDRDAYRSSRTDMSPSLSAMDQKIDTMRQAAAEEVRQVSRRLEVMREKLPSYQAAALRSADQQYSRTISSLLLRKL